MIGRLFVSHTKAVKSQQIDDGAARTNVANAKQTLTRLVTISICQKGLRAKIKRRLISQPELINAEAPDL